MGDFLPKPECLDNALFWRLSVGEDITVTTVAVLETDVGGLCMAGVGLMLLLMRSATTGNNVIIII